MSIWNRSSPTSNEAGPESLTVCSFCYKTQDEVRTMVSGRDAAVCDECIDLCNEVIEKECEREVREATSQPLTVGLDLKCSLCRFPIASDGEGFVVPGHAILCFGCIDAIRGALEGASDEASGTANSSVPADAARRPRG